MRNERASQPGAARPKYRCLAEPTIDEASLLAACRSMARRPRRCADAAIDGLVHDRWLMRRLLAMLRPTTKHNIFISPGGKKLTTTGVCVPKTSSVLIA